VAQVYRFGAESAGSPLVAYLEIPRQLNVPRPQAGARARARARHVPLLRFPNGLTG